MEANFARVSASPRGNLVKVICFNCSLFRLPFLYMAFTFRYSPVIRRIIHSESPNTSIGRIFHASAMSNPAMIPSYSARLSFCGQEPQTSSFCWDGDLFRGDECYPYSSLRAHRNRMKCGLKPLFYCNQDSQKFVRRQGMIGEVIGYRLAVLPVKEGLIEI